MVTNETTSDESIEHDYQSAEDLRELYHGEGMNLSEVADKTGCSTTTVADWMEHHGIPRRKSGPGGNSEPNKPENPIDHTDPDVLRDLYVDQKLSLKDIEARSTVTHETIRHHLLKHDIEPRTRQEGFKETMSDHPAYYMQASNGYRTWKDQQSGRYMSVHRLLAIAEYGFDAVDGNSVHHKNGIRWDNRPANIEVMTPSEHAKHHVENGDFVMSNQQ